MTEIVIEQTWACHEIIVGKNTFSDVYLWQDKDEIIIDKKRLPALITALQQMQENPKTK